MLILNNCMSVHFINLILFLNHHNFILLNDLVHDKARYSCQVPYEKNIFHFNPSCRFAIIDTYGGWGAHGGGASSGKNPTKVDRSGAYIVRQASKSIVANGLARRCIVSVSYAIGVPEPLSVFVDSFGTCKPFFGAPMHVLLSACNKSNLRLVGFYKNVRRN